MKIQLLTVGLSISACLFAACSRDDDDKSVRPCPVQDAVDNEYYFPDAFSPNGDGRNDVLRIIEGAANAELGSQELRISDASDNVVAVIFGTGNGWDGTDQRSGKPAPAGLYHLSFGIVTRQNGATPALATDGEGFVTLFRGPAGGCLQRQDCDPARYVFADQIDPVTAKRAYSTAEVFCN